MGAMAYVTNYYNKDTTKDEAEKLSELTKNNNRDYLVAQDKYSTTTKDETETLGQNSLAFKRSAITSIGEYSSTYGASTAEDCRIGNQIIPQVQLCIM